MTDEDMYDEYYVEDNEDKGPRDENYPLPDIIKEWITVGSEYSRYNRFPLTMCYFNIMGQIVKDFIQIPHGANRLDSRLHFVWLQTARTGKSATWKLMNTTLQGVYENINKKAIKNNLNTFDTFDISVYTSAALIGTFVENEAFDTDEPESDTNPRKIFIPGALDGSGIAHWDEFESSGIFKMKKHNEDMLLTFQTFLTSQTLQTPLASNISKI